MPKLTKAEAVRVFKEEILPHVEARYPNDKPARDQAWNDWTDALCKEGRITLEQYETWTHPFNKG